MSFTGDLEHLPIVDVIQLLHSTRKSGILRIQGRKGESRLVFKDGYIVSASHLNNSVRIGKILVDRKLISRETLDRVLQEQKAAGPDRKPLIVTLIDQGLIREQDAYRSLEALIEMTIVEILTWKKGAFSLDLKTASAADEYKYYPERMSQEINVDTQGVLMDALRIYDEKIRDGELTEEGLSEEEDFFVDPIETGNDSGEGRDDRLSAEDLGLDRLDELESNIPQVFSGLQDLDPLAGHRRKIGELVPSLGPAAVGALAACLAGFPSTPASPGATGKPERPLVLVGADPFLDYVMTALGRSLGMPVFPADEEPETELLLRRALAGNVEPLLVFDRPAPGEAPRQEKLSRMRVNLLGTFPDLTAFQFTAPGAFEPSLQAYREGITAVFPRPLPEEQPDTFAEDTMTFLRSFHRVLQRSITSPGSNLAAGLGAWVSALGQATEAPAAAEALLRCTAQIFRRVVTLIVRGEELVAEKGAGMAEGGQKGGLSSMSFKIPLAGPSIFRDVIEGGTLFYGECDDPVVKDYLFSAIGAPQHPAILLLPIRSQGKTIALTYGDFGRAGLSAVPTGLLLMLSTLAGVAIENGSLRKRLKKTT